MIMRFLMALFFVVSETNGVPFLERDEGEFLKGFLRTCSCYFCLFWYQIRHIHCLWWCLLLSYVFSLNKRELKNHSLVILNRNIAPRSFFPICTIVTFIWGVSIDHMVPWLGKINENPCSKQVISTLFCDKQKWLVSWRSQNTNEVNYLYPCWFV